MAEDRVKGEKPAGEILGFDHISFWVGNALQAANFYVTRFGFKIVAYKGLETGSRKHVAYVLRQNNVQLFYFNVDDTVFNDHLVTHGDGVRDVAFTVNNCRLCYDEAIKRGGQSVQEPKEESDAHGKIVTATIRTYGDTVHTFVERSDYKGIFLPGFQPRTADDPFYHLADDACLMRVDHVVGNQPDGAMVPIVEFYEKVLQFHRFWSVDDKTIHTEFSSLRSIVVTDWHERVKMPMNEPAPGKRKSQIQESVLLPLVVLTQYRYVDYYYGPGVQHIALLTSDIITAITQLRKRGVQFLDCPKAYYDNLKAKLAHAPIKVKEDLEQIEKLHILIDYDDKGYLLQIFTKPVEDRPTLFFEVIQRNNHFGFGAGNFKALFEAIEAEQAKRGNL